MGPCPNKIGGQCLSILPPIELNGQTSADTQGIAHFSFLLPDPGPVSSLEVAFQAVAVRGQGGVDSLISNPMTVLFEEDPLAPTQDMFTHEPARIDVLFVVDNSCSMAEEQALLAMDFPTMIAPFQQSGVDWHVGVISTDTVDQSHSGRLREFSGYRYVDSNTPDPHIVFTNMAVMGTSGSAIEMGLEATGMSLVVHGTGYNAGFFRRDAQFSVFVLSDEDDSSPTEPDFASWFLGLRPTSSDLTFNSIVSLGDCPNTQQGFRYLDVTAQVGGIEWSVCDGNYDQALSSGASMWWTSQPMVLSQVPVDPSLIQVIAEEPNQLPRVLTATEWGYESADNSVRTRPPYTPPIGTTYTVQYH